MPPKRRKGKRGDDSDDDPLADQLNFLNLKNDDKTKDDAEEEDIKKGSKKQDKKNAKKVEEDARDDKQDASKKGGKKEKGKDKKGKKGDSDDDVDPMSTMRKLAQESEDEDEAPAVVTKKDAPAKKKDKDKKKKKGNDSDEDDVDPLAHMKKLADEDESEEDIPKPQQKGKAKKEEETSKSKSEDAKKSTKDKKKNKKGHHSDDDESGDNLAHLKKIAAEESEEEDSDNNANSKKQSKNKDSKKDKKNDKDKDNKNNNKSDNKKKDKSSKKKKDESDEEERSDEEANEDEDEAPLNNNNSNNNNNKEEVIPSIPTPSTTTTTTAKAQQQQQQAIPEPLPKPQQLSKREIKQQEYDRQYNVTLQKITVREQTLQKEQQQLEEQYQQILKQQEQLKNDQDSNNNNAVEKASDKKKSKLELKLEKAKKEKEGADAVKSLETSRAKIEMEKSMKALELQKILLEKEELKALREAQAEEESSSEEEDDDDDDDDNDDNNNSNNQKSQEELEREARMMSTMYGDDVFDEHAHPTGDNDVTSSGKGKKSKDKDKLSNKAKRRLAKEAEAKEREIEYNKLAMKASIEGAQFAVSQTIIDPNDPTWQNALDIVIPNFSISAHNKELFVNAELKIVHGGRYGLVGPNGAGKSTLLKMIAAGELKVPPRVDYLYVEQEVMADDTPAVDAVLKADKVRWELVQEEKRLEKELDVKADEAKSQRLGEIYEQLSQINASAAEAKARRILFGLGFDAEMQIRPTKYFSGGWRMRISLARALFIEPTLLMLDEPTNHLDLNAVIWLDDYLQKWKKTLLVVSHDQDFLNSVCQEIIHLDEKKFFFYRGNYDTFKEQDANRRKQQLKDWEKQEKKLRELKNKGITKANAEQAQLKSKSREPGARSAKKKEAAAQAQGGLESAESQTKLIARPRDYVVVFSFPPVAPLNPPILEVRDVNFRYGPNLPWLFRGLNFGIDLQSRICIVGPNGSGKSTVIKLITEEVKPPEGEVYRNPRLRIGVYNQHFVDRLPMEEDPVSYLQRLFNKEDYQSIRNKLGKYGLEGHAHTIPIRDLSGGQKARVVFVELSFMAPDLLFLDEPTNNLDIESIDALCDALKEYNGGVILVSHDARLIESTDCQLWVVDDKSLTPWTAGFANYREHLLEKLEAQLAAILPGSGERPTNK